MNKQYKLFSLPIIIIISAMITSCSSLRKKQPGIKSNTDSDIGAQLISSARSIEKSLATLAANQEINNLPILNTAPLITQEGGMGGTADIDWTGPLEPLLEKIASMSNYALKTMGNTPAIPIIVSISQEKAMIADILKNACLQAGKRANIVVFPASKIIELRYRFGPIAPDLQQGKTNG